MNPSRSPRPPGSRASNESIRRLLNRAIQRGRSPGLIAAIVDRRGVRAIAAAGVRKAGHAQPLLTTDLVHIGSNTKAMTATMLAMLVHDGVFASGWNTSIAEVFPELRDDIHPHYHAVTLWQLVTMTGGIQCDAADWHAHGDVHLIERRYRILRENLADPPGAAARQHLYSNLAYVVAGAMAERLTARTWESLMRERLFTPLGISSAGFGAPGAPGAPWGHQRDPDSGNWVPGQHDNAAALGPAGTVHIAIEDWARFFGLWLSREPPAIVDRETLNRLVTPVAGRYAAGWLVVRRLWARGRAITHDGSNGSWCTKLWVAPAVGRAYVVAANSAEPDDHRTFALLDGIVSGLMFRGLKWRSRADHRAFARAGLNCHTGTGSNRDMRCRHSGE